MNKEIDKIYSEAILDYCPILKTNVRIVRIICVTISVIIFILSLTSLIKPFAAKMAANLTSQQIAALLKEGLSYLVFGIAALTIERFSKFLFDKEKF